jgi:UDPglucose 6-dehydrogenase
MKKRNIGCIGFGFIGKSVAHAFGNDNEIRFWARNENNCTKKEMFEKSEFIFLALPTPMAMEDGKIDLSIIDSVLKEISDYGYDGITIIKSTIVPGSCDKFIEKYPNIKLVFNPEFLTARSAKLDFINATRIILGGPGEYVNQVEELYRTRFVHTPIFKTDYKTAEFIKYMCNNFFSTKVIYMNMMYKIAEKFGIDWDTSVKGFLSDMRIGNSHYQVPGHDGDFGFGGYCFPKDINAFLHWLVEIGMKDEADFFELVWKLNLKYRKNRDWEHLESAVSKKE